MEKNRVDLKKATAILTGILVCIFAIAAFLMLYLYDNKYTASGPKGVDGTLVLSESALNDEPVVFLVEGWAYYADRLLEPEAFTSDTPPEPTSYIFIGGLNGFEEGSVDHSPHGSASYKMTIKIPQDMRTYMLELPEIFSAYKLYVNGTLAAEMGNPNVDNYWPKTGNSSLTIEAKDTIELLFNVSDYSHFYSGMVYPPAFGYGEDVSNLLNQRLVLRTILCAITLTIGFIAILFSFLNRKKTLPALYGLLCLSLIGFASYPITATFVSNMQPLYVIERFSFCAMLLLMVLLIRKLYAMKSNWTKLFLIFGVFMCLFSLILPALISSGNLNGMLVYSTFISIYEWLIALFITITTCYYCYHNIFPAKVLIVAILVFDCALVVDRLLPLYEPILSGWFIELASFLLIIAIGIVIGQKVAAQYNETAILNERTKNIEHLYQTQKTYFNLLKEEAEDLKKVRHDMHHHFTMIDGFIKNHQYDALSKYVSTWQPFLTDNQIKTYCTLDVINILSHHFDLLAKKQAIDFHIRCHMDKDRKIHISDSDLCSLYSNLIENAIEACQRIKEGKRFIKVAIVEPSGDSLMIRVWNSVDNDRIIKKNDTFLSTKDGHKGYGLLSIKTIVEKYDGSASFVWHKRDHIYESKIILNS